MPRRELKQRLSESRAKRIFALPNRWSSESHQACLNQRSTAEGKVNGRVVTEVGVANVSCFNRARALLACYRRDARRLNNHNTAERMATKFGHSDNLITLSLSLSLSGARLYKRDNNTSYFTRGSPASIYDFSCVHAREVGLFFCPRRTTAAGDKH